MDDMVAELLKEQNRQCAENTKVSIMKREKAKVDKALDNLVMALEQGITPAYIAVGAAAGLRRYIAEAEGMEQGMDAAKQVLCEVSKLTAESELAKLILNMYEKILGGATIYDLRRAADAVKASTLTPIV